jgi:CrcB protein
MTVNIVGSFAMGVLVAWLALKADIAGWPGTIFGSGQNLRLFLATGVLGGFTTFSAFSLDAMLLWERGETGLAALYVLGSVVLSLAGLVGGLALVRALL